MELFGDFVPFADKMGQAGDGSEGGKPPLIYGQTDSGQEITLFDSFWTNRQYGSAGHVRSDYTSNLCIIGAWFEGEDDVSFDKLELKLTHLEPWLDVNPFHADRIMQGEKRVGAKFTYTFHDEITVEISDPRLTVKLAAHLTSGQ